ncbi:MAG: hypothetical protein J6U85_03795 [Bacteroidales bacterium]|nr:hypothetical protein [Bacteroidales bacterium]
MQKNSFLYYSLVLLLLLLPILLLSPRRGGISYNEVRRDTTIFNVTYRDTIIYNVHKKDSVITDYTLVPLHDSIIINDTVYIVLPLSAYHFSDSLADIYVTGYNVTLDSFLLHRKEVIVTVQKDIIIPPKRLTANVGISLLNCDGWNILLDGSANFRINDKLSIDADVGIVATGNNLLPFAKGGLKYRLR